MSRQPICIGDFLLAIRRPRIPARGGRAGAFGFIAVLTCGLCSAAAQGPAGGLDGTTTQPALDPNAANVPLAEIPAAAIPSTQPASRREDEPEVWARYEKAQDLVEHQQFAQAVVELDIALRQVMVPDPDLLYLLAQAKRGLGRMGEARLAAQLAAVYRPGSPEIYLLLGRLERDEGHLDAAGACFRTVTLSATAQPNNPTVTVAWY